MTSITIQIVYPEIVCFRCRERFKTNIAGQYNFFDPAARPQAFTLKEPPPEFGGNIGPHPCYAVDGISEALLERLALNHGWGRIAPLTAMPENRVIADAFFCCPACRGTILTCVRLI